MKFHGWIILIISIGIAAWATIYVNNWSGGWKNLFFYEDNWVLLVIIFMLAYAATELIKWFLNAEVQVLK